eukprot:1618866-Prymnesium_polylepis.1
MQSARVLKAPACHTSTTSDRVRVRGHSSFSGALSHRWVCARSCTGGCVRALAPVGVSADPTQRRLSKNNRVRYLWAGEAPDCPSFHTHTRAAPRASRGGASAGGSG